MAIDATQILNVIELGLILGAFYGKDKTFTQALHKSLGSLFADVKEIMGFTNDSTVETITLLSKPTHGIDANKEAIPVTPLEQKLDSLIENVQNILETLAGNQAELHELNGRVTELEEPKLPVSAPVEGT